MQLFETIDRAKRMHGLIQHEATGDPQQFAERLHLCRRQFFNPDSAIEKILSLHFIISNA